MAGSDDDALTAEQRVTLEAVKRWLSIRGRAGDAKLVADIDHSALLRRLLAGHEPLAHPPPVSFSYPWYDLIETGQGDAADVFETSPEWAVHLAGRLIINQSPQWTIVERCTDGSWVVECETNGLHFRVTPAAQRGGQPVWFLQRVERRQSGG